MSIQEIAQTERASLRSDGKGHPLRQKFGQIVGLACEHPLLTVFAVALITRLGLATAILLLTDGTLALDDQTYHYLATMKAEGSTDEWGYYLHFLYDATATLLVPITFLYKIFGPVRFLGVLVVVAFGVATAILGTRLAMEFLPRSAALLGGLFIAVLPSQIVWSSVILKDASVWFVLTGTALTVALASKSKGRRLASLGLVLCGFLYLLAHLRDHTLVVVTWALVLTCWIGNKEAKKQRIAGALAIAIFIPWWLGVGPLGLDFVMNSGSLQNRRTNNAFGANTAIVEPPLILGAEDNDSHETRSDQSANEGGPGSGQSAAEGPRTPGKAAGGVAHPGWESTTDEEPNRVWEDIRPGWEQVSPPSSKPEREDADSFFASTILNPNVRHVPRGLEVMLFEPVPWGSGGTSALKAARLEAYVWYPLLLLSLVGLLWAWRHKATMAFPVVACTGVLMMYALSEGNVGTAFRHRGEFVWLVCLLAAGGLHIIHTWWLNRLEVRPTTSTFDSSD